MPVSVRVSMNQNRVSFGLLIMLVVLLLMVSVLFIRRPQQTLAQGPAATDAQPTALSAADSLQLTLQSQMPTLSQAGVQTTCGAGWSIELVRTREVPLTDGWKLVTGDIAYRNVNASY